MEDTYQRTSTNNFANDEIEIVVPVYSQKFSNIRHLQNLRLNYLNYLLVILGISISAIIAIIVNFSDLILLLLLFIITLFVYFYSLFTLSRLIRIDSLISHDIRTIRQIEQGIRIKVALLSNVLTIRSTSNVHEKTNGSILSKYRVEHWMCIVIAAIALSMFLSFLMYSTDVLTIYKLVGILLVGGFIVFGYFRQNREREIQYNKHKECCHNK